VVRAGGDVPSEVCGVGSGSASSLEDPGLSSGSRGLRGVWEVFHSFEWSPGSPWRSRSRSWVLPCSPLGLRAVAGWPSGSSADSAPSMSEDIFESASVAFAPVQSSCSVRVGSLRPSSPGLRLGELTLAGFARLDFPFIDLASGVHSREALQPRFGKEGTTFSACSALVVLHHLGGFLLRSFAGLLRPAADPGVHRVSVVVRLSSSSEELDSTRPIAFPAMSVSYPSKAPPLPQPRHVTVTVASLVFDPSPSRWVSPSRPCSAVESVALPRRCRQFHALSFLGFVPLQGPRGSVFDLFP